MEQIDALPSVSKYLLMGSICAFWGMNLGAKYMFKSYLDPQGFLCHPTITSARYMSPTGGKNTSKKCAETLEHGNGSASTLIFIQQHHFLYYLV